MLKDKLRHIKRISPTSIDIFGFFKKYCNTNKVFLLTFYCLYIVILAISFFIVLNYESNLTHDNYYQLLMQGDYDYVKVSLKYFLYNLLVTALAVITYRKKYAFACLYFIVTFIAYRLAVNIVGSWQYSNLINILNAILFYFPIFTAYVVVIVITVCYINTNYLYCNDTCPITIKKMLIFAITLLACSTVFIIIHTVLYPFITTKILF